MSTTWVKAWKNTPRIDCGLCGAANCSSFARLLTVGEIEMDKCPILNLPEFANMRMQLELNSGRGGQIGGRPAAKPPEGGMLLSRPCRDSDEKVMAELRVFNGVPEGQLVHFGAFDPQLLCSLVSCLSSTFDLVKCSRDLGYGRAEIDDLSITILQDGRINMRRVSNEERVLELFGIIERSILGSVICNCCGGDLLTVLLGFVEPKDVKHHPVLNAGSSLSLVERIIERGPARLDSKGIPTGCLPAAEVNIRRRHEEILTMIRTLRKGTVIAMKEEDEAFPCDFVEMLKASDDARLVTSLLICIGTGYVQQNAMKGLEALSAIVQKESRATRDQIDEWLDLVLSGKNLPPFSDKWPSILVRSYAHVMRVYRAVSLLTRS